MIKVCIAYYFNGEEIDYFLSSTEDLAKVEPIYVDMQVWQTCTEGIRSFDKLPLNAQKYVHLLLLYLL
jgi:adenylosuccinate synthase